MAKKSYQFPMDNMLFVGEAKHGDVLQWDGRTVLLKYGPSFVYTEPKAVDRYSRDLFVLRGLVGSMSQTLGLEVEIGPLSRARKEQLRFQASLKGI